MKRFNSDSVTVSIRGRLLGQQDRGSSACRSSPSTSRLRPVRKVINGVLGTIGVGLMLYVVVRALGDLGGFWTRENAKDLLVAPVLTLTLVPFLCLVAWVSKRELDNLRKPVAGGS